jgi:hypothetical protein
MMINDDNMMTNDIDPYRVIQRKQFFNLLVKDLKGTDPALCRIALDHDTMLCRIAWDFFV